MERAAAIRRGLLLEYATLGYNVLEASIALAAGMAASSIALVGFGIDSAIEVSSGLIMLWRLHSGEGSERRALRLIGCSFLALAVYVGWEGAETLWNQAAPRHSLPGILLAILSILIMPWVARAKRRVGQAIDSAAMVADSRQTQLCAWLSMILLGGLVLNAAFGWWWADPVAALIMAPIIAREGWDALKGRSCGCAHGH